jgi:hypothetical protein
VIAFIVAVGLTATGAMVTAGWHVLSKHDPPKFEDLGVGFDILVGAIVMQIAFIPGSRGQEAAVRWAGVGALFLMLTIMAVCTRFLGYEEGQQFSGSGKNLTVYTMKVGAVKWTSGIGCLILCLFWVLNEHISWVLSALKGLSH